jgi:hypothetical protein
LREAYAKIRELERALGRKTMEVEILRAAQEIVKNAVVAQRVRVVTTYFKGDAPERALGGGPRVRGDLAGLPYVAFAASRQMIN